MNEQYRSGLREAGRYLLRILILIVIVLTLCSFIFWFRFSMSMNLGNVVQIILIQIVLIAPISILAFFEGCCPVGSKERLIVRIVMNLLLILIITVVAHSVTYNVGSSLMLDDPVHMNDVSANIDLDRIYLLMLPLPAISLVDAFAEYRFGPED